MPLKLYLRDVLMKVTSVNTVYCDDIRTGFILLSSASPENKTTPQIRELF